MHKTFATLVSLLCLALIAGYMASYANAATLNLVSVAASAAAPAGQTAKSKKSKAAAKKSSKATAKAGKTSAAKATSSKAKHKVAAHGGKHAATVRRVAYHPEAERPTVGRSLGLHKTADALALRSNAAMVVDQDTGEVLYEKNAHAVLPIASITKLMTALVVLDAGLPLDETISIDNSDIDTEKGTHSRLALGTTLSRHDALHLALMASENRAASALGRHYPGGIEAFVAAMNAKAHSLEMTETRYVDSNGLSPRNQSSANDLAKLVRAAYAYPLIRELSTSTSHTVQVGRRMVEFHSTNRLVSNPNWEIGLQKTGYISEAGRCLVMQATIDDRRVVMVLLDSWGKYSRIGDAGRIRDWVESNPVRVKTVSSTGAKTEI